MSHHIVIIISNSQMLTPRDIINRISVIIITVVVNAGDPITIEAEAAEGIKL